jgi:hypothetical protein
VLRVLFPVYGSLLACCAQTEKGAVSWIEGEPEVIQETLSDGSKIALRDVNHQPTALTLQVRVRGDGEVVDRSPVTEMGMSNQPGAHQGIERSIDGRQMHAWREIADRFGNVIRREMRFASGKYLQNRDARLRDSRALGAQLADRGGKPRGVASWDSSGRHEFSLLGICGCSLATAALFAASTLNEIVPSLFDRLRPICDSIALSYGSGDARRSP